MKTDKTPDRFYSKIGMPWFSQDGGSMSKVETAK